MNCTVCGGEMKQLFTGYYCPKNCDRPSAQATPAVEEGRHYYIRDYPGNEREIGKRYSGVTKFANVDLDSSIMQYYRHNRRTRIYRIQAHKLFGDGKPDRDGDVIAQDFTVIERIQ